MPKVIQLISKRAEVWPGEPARAVHHRPLSLGEDEEDESVHSTCVERLAGRRTKSHPTGTSRTVTREARNAMTGMQKEGRKSFLFLHSILVPPSWSWLHSPATPVSSASASSPSPCPLLGDVSSTPSHAGALLNSSLFLALPSSLLAIKELQGFKTFTNACCPPCPFSHTHQKMCSQCTLEIRSNSCLLAAEYRI